MTVPEAVVSGETFWDRPLLARAPGRLTLARRRHVGRRGICRRWWRSAAGPAAVSRLKLVTRLIEGGSLLFHALPPTVGDKCGAQEREPDSELQVDQLVRAGDRKSVG